MKSTNRISYIAFVIIMISSIASVAQYSKSKINNPANIEQDVNDKIISK